MTGLFLLQNPMKLGSRCGDTCAKDIRDLTHIYVQAYATVCVFRCVRALFKEYFVCISY